MRSTRRPKQAIATVCVAIAVIAASAGSASAATFYVNERGGSATCAGRGINACGTIKEAIVQAEGTAPPNTIEVEEGTYKETIELASIRDKNLTINGEDEPGEISAIVNTGQPQSPSRPPPAK